jgi:hypothetical protein
MEFLRRHTTGRTRFAELHIASTWQNNPAYVLSLGIFAAVAKKKFAGRRRGKSVQWLRGADDFLFEQQR